MLLNKEEHLRFRKINRSYLLMADEDPDLISVLIDQDIHISWAVETLQSELLAAIKNIREKNPEEDLSDLKKLGEIYEDSLQSELKDQMKYDLLSAAMEEYATKQKMIYMLNAQELKEEKKTLQELEKDSLRQSEELSNLLDTYSSGKTVHKGEELIFMIDQIKNSIKQRERHHKELIRQLELIKKIDS